MSQQFQEKRGAEATWRLTTEGLTILVTQSESGRQGQTDQIPVHAIREVTVNRYSPLCLMTLYVDPARRFNALVCRCHTDEDAANIVQVFRQLQRSQSGEGFRIDLKQPRGINWTLKSKHNGEGSSGGGGEGGGINGHGEDELSANGSIRSRDGGGGGGGGVGFVHNNNNNYGELVVEMEEESLEREALEVDGRSCFHVGVQAELGPEDDSDRDSTASDVSYQSLKDELVSLSNEVRDIKLLLEQTTGISAEEFFRRQREPGAPRLLLPVKRLLSHESDGAESGTSGGGGGGGGGGGEKRVNFAAPPGDEDMDFDIRSVGMQTADPAGGWRRGKYTKRARHPAFTPPRYQQGPHYPQARSASGSYSPSPQASPAASFTSPGTFFTYSYNGQRYADPRRDLRFGSASLSKASLSKASLYGSGGGGGGGTVVRPIESVYHAHSSGFRQKRKQVIVLPNRSASVPRSMRRAASDAAPPRGPGQAEPPKSSAAAAAHNGAS